MTLGALLACADPVYSPPLMEEASEETESQSATDDPPASVTGGGSETTTDDLAESSEEALLPPSDTPPDESSVEPQNPPDTELAGCIVPPTAAEPIGYGRATTGGGDADAVVVRSFAEAERALDTYRAAFQARTQNALVLRYLGVFDYSTIENVCDQHEKEPQTLRIQDMENLTIEGVQGSSGNFGIHVDRARNIIVRNMTLGLLPGGEEADTINIEGNGTNGTVENIWIDHNELFSSTKDDCPGAGDAEFDGLIDIKNGARRVTVSYNFLHDHQGVGLLGFSDTDETERYVTFHHNRYENVASRTPLHRFGYVHVFNNYFGRITKSGVNVRMGGLALIESNFFENVHNPVTSRYSDSEGFWELRNNHIGTGISWDFEPGTLINAEDWATTAVFPREELDYPYELDPASCVKQIVRATAGATL